MSEKIQEEKAAKAPTLVQGDVEILSDKVADIAADLYAEGEQYSPEELAAARKAVLRKIDMRIMPIVCAFAEKSCTR